VAEKQAVEATEELVAKVGNSLVVARTKPNGDEMEARWDNILANWATDRATSVSNALDSYSATPAWQNARERHFAGASELVVRQLLDMAMASVNPKPS